MLHFSCGVCWYDDHVNLDCSECGGYAMCRPCPKCNGKCGAMWKRDVTTVSINFYSLMLANTVLYFRGLIDINMCSAIKSYLRMI